MRRIRAALRRLERTFLGSLMRIGAKIANRRVAKEVQNKRAHTRDDDPAA